MALRTLTERQNEGIHKPSEILPEAFGGLITAADGVIWGHDDIKYPGMMSMIA